MAEEFFRFLYNINSVHSRGVPRESSWNFEIQMCVFQTALSIYFVCNQNVTFSPLLKSLEESNVENRSYALQWLQQRDLTT